MTIFPGESGSADCLHNYPCSLVPDLSAFRALTLLAGRQEEYLAYKKLSDEVLSK